MFGVAATATAAEAAAAAATVATVAARVAGAGREKRSSTVAQLLCLGGGGGDTANGVRDGDIGGIAVDRAHANRHPGGRIRAALSEGGVRMGVRDAPAYSEVGELVGPGVVPGRVRGLGLGP